MTSAATFAPCVKSKKRKPSRMSGNNLFKMPSPWDTKNCPSFDGKTAESLTKYLKHCKMIIEGSGTSTDEGKKEILLKFAQRVIQEEWEGLATYKTGTFEKWVTEIESLFPEIKAIKDGSLTCLITNPVLVGKYLSAFERKFADEIESMITFNLLNRDDTKIAAAAKAAATAGTPADRPEETISLEDLLILVEKMTKTNMVQDKTVSSLLAMSSDDYSRDSAGSSKDITKLKGKIKEKLDLFAGDIALIKDNANLTENRLNLTLTTSLAERSTNFTKALNQAIRGPAPYQEIVQAGQASKNDGQDKGFAFRSNENRDCYYCYLTGHMVWDCPYKREYIDCGRILIENGRMKLGDGSAFPGYLCNISQKQRVDDYYANKLVPGAPIVLMQIYNHPRAEQVSQYNVNLINNLNTVYDSRDDEQRITQDTESAGSAGITVIVGNVNRRRWRGVMLEGLNKDLKDLNLNLNLNLSSIILYLAIGAMQQYY
ncbi:hypothetical protein B0H17DRAFT_1136355 [Mycena rosella]|uniref:CCHC-type domain-containing protein n=1 Tax=Mycena rosella TaxID=1033263 RepID=A0AAD7GEH2_MYCRO|nr:hypothetical protein B0H17DRAFT_1136355 [Mycena rosella]